MENIIGLKEKLGEYDIREINKLDFNWFVYSYEYDSYEGSGFAIWRKVDKYYYDYLGHCSCYGATENILKAAYSPVTFEQLKDIAERNQYGNECIEYIIKNKMNK